MVHLTPGREGTRKGGAEGGGKGCIQFVFEDSFSLVCL